jgi:hypothetical protein
MTAPTLPDLEATLVAWAAAKFTGVRSVAELPANLGDVLPVIQWQGIGGGDVARTMWTQTFDFDCYAATRSGASTLASAVWSALLWDLPGFVGAGFTVGEVRTFAVPAWRPYDNTKLRRFGGGVEAFVHLTNT